MPWAWAQPKKQKTQKELEEENLYIASKDLKQNKHQTSRFSVAFEILDRVISEPHHTTSFMSKDGTCTFQGAIVPSSPYCLPNSKDQCHLHLSSRLKCCFSYGKEESELIIPMLLSKADTWKTDQEGCSFLEPASLVLEISVGTLDPVLSKS